MSTMRGATRAVGDARAFRARARGAGARAGPVATLERRRVSAPVRWDHRGDDARRATRGDAMTRASRTTMTRGARERDARARAGARDETSVSRDAGDVGDQGREATRGGPREDLEGLFGADYSGDGLSTQGEAVVKGVAAVEDKPSGMTLDVDYLQELIAIQEDCPKEIGFFGTRNMGFMHQQLIEILAYALCLTGNHIYTSGATGTNAAVIRGALRAEQPELLTVVLPQSLAKQPRESRELLEGVAQIVEAPENDGMPLVEASRICNDTIVSKVKQIIVFAFHDSRLLLETCRNAKTMRKLVTLFYLD